MTIHALRTNPIWDGPRKGIRLDRWVSEASLLEEPPFVSSVAAKVITIMLREKGEN